MTMIVVDCGRSDGPRAYIYAPSPSVARDLPWPGGATAACVRARSPIRKSTRACTARACAHPRGSPGRPVSPSGSSGPEMLLHRVPPRNTVQRPLHRIG